MSEQTIKRTDSIRVKLAPSMVERVERLAEAYCMPTATICAFAVAEWVAGKENNLRLARDAVMGIGAQVGGEMQKALGDFAHSPQFDQLALQASSAMSQPNLPLDGEAAPGAAE